jgi:hypothetical protein
MLRRLIKNALLQLGFAAVPIDTDAAATLIRELHPVLTRFPLVRIGGHGDGAYLVPDDMDGIAGLFSPGVAETATFESYFADRGIPCYLADASVDMAPVDHPLFFFDPLYIGISDYGIFKTLDSWVNLHAPGDSDLILQMDIENAEWGVLANVSNATLCRFRIIVIEFHGVDRILDSTFHRDVLYRLLQTHHVVHAHPNNSSRIISARGIPIPPLLEVSFLRKDRAEAIGLALQFPHELDVTNVPDNAAVALPANWYGG